MKDRGHGRIGIVSSIAAIVPTPHLVPATGALGRLLPPVAGNDHRSDTRAAMDELETVEPLTQDLLISDAQKLELFHWFVRAQLEDAGGALHTEA